jgi:chromosome segregation ATPase
VIEEFCKRLDRIKSEYQELDAAADWFDEQMAKPDLDRAALHAVWVRLKNRTAELQEEISDFERALG